MQSLISFPHDATKSGTDNTLSSREFFLLEADLQVKGSTIYLEFRFLDQSLEQKGEFFELPKTAASWDEFQVPRQDGLWNATCFEAFLNPLGSSKYFECNFALTPAWNAYQFEAYRSPQPATPTADFVLKSMSWDPQKHQLLIELQNKSTYRQFRVGLTAILLEKTGVKHYCALVHKGRQPDFHSMDSFILHRGSES